MGYNLNNLAMAARAKGIGELVGILRDNSPDIKGAYINEPRVRREAPAELPTQQEVAPAESKAPASNMEQNAEYAKAFNAALKQKEFDRNIEEMWNTKVKDNKPMVEGERNIGGEMVDPSKVVMPPTPRPSYQGPNEVSPVPDYGDPTLPPPANPMLGIMNSLIGTPQQNTNSVAGMTSELASQILGF